MLDDTIVYLAVATYIGLGIVVAGILEGILSEENSEKMSLGAITIFALCWPTIIVFGVGSIIGRLVRDAIKRHEKSEPKTRVRIQLLEAEVEDLRERLNREKNKNAERKIR